jgi:hypothetical protein
LEICIRMRVQQMDSGMYLSIYSEIRGIIYIPWTCVLCCRFSKWRPHGINFSLRQDHIHEILLEIIIRNTLDSVSNQLILKFCKSQKKIQPKFLWRIVLSYNFTYIQHLGDYSHKYLKLTIIFYNHSTSWILNNLVSKIKH